ncbi:MAG TPA: YbhN family protein [Candidatus Saccharimonadales bacterium]
MNKTASRPKISWLRLFYLLLTSIFIYVIISQISSLRGSLTQIKTSNLGYDLLAVLAIMVSYLFGSLTYYVISIKPLFYWRTVVVELGINTINKLLPAGIGAIGGNFFYLKKSGHSNLQSASVVFINNLLGIIGNLLLLGVLLVFVPHVRFSHVASVSRVFAVIILATLFLMILSLSLPGIRSKLKKLGKDFVAQLKVYKTHKSKLPVGLICSIGLTLGSVMTLSFCLKAVHGYLPISSLMLAYSFAIWISSIIPAPGGFGPVDAGLVAALVAFGINLNQAIACVLIFSLVSFWLPLVGGVPALIWSRRKGYI